MGCFTIRDPEKRGKMKKSKNDFKMLMAANEGDCDAISKNVRLRKQEMRSTLLGLTH